MSQIVDSFPDKQPRPSKYDKYMDGQIHRIVPASELRKRMCAAEAALRAYAHKKNLSMKLMKAVEKVDGRALNVIYVQNLGPKVEKLSVPAEVVTDPYLTEA